MVKRRKTTKQSHHLWQSNATNDGDVMINRTKAEREDLDDLELYQARSAASLGLWGASMTDLGQFSRLPHNASKHYSKVARELQESGETAPKVMSWKNLNTAFGADKVASVKESIEFGMKARLASKELNIPFVMAADLVEDWEKVGTAVLKDVIDSVKERKTSSAPKALVRKVQEILSSPVPKIAIDQAAAEYYKAYYGPFGESLVKEVKKRVKADLSKLWMVKQGVDEAAAEYWSAYYADTGYGADMTKAVKDRKKAQSKKAQGWDDSWDDEDGTDEGSPSIEIAYKSPNGDVSSFWLDLSDMSLEEVQSKIDEVGGTIYDASGFGEYPSIEDQPLEVIMQAVDAIKEFGVEDYIERSEYL